MAITKGHQVLCCDRNRRGGLKNIWLIEQDKLTGTPTVDATSGMYDSFPTSNAYQFDFDRGTGGFNANAARENGSTLITLELVFYIPKVTEVVNARLRELAGACGMFAIVETYADDCATPTAATYFFVLGYDTIFDAEAYLEFGSGEQTTGVGLQDANGTAITLTGSGGEYPRGIDTTAGNAVMTAGATYTDAWSIT